MMESLVAWTILTLGWLLPLVHVTLSSRGGPWHAPQGTGCPLSPRLGWLVLVLLAGPLGWLLFMRSRGKSPRVRS